MAAAVAATTWLMWRDSNHSLSVMTFWTLVAAVLLWGLTAHLRGERRYAHNPIASGRVLAIVPTYNEANANVHATVRSLLEQTVACDIIVVDDGSAEALAPFLHPRVRWVRQYNGGKRQAQVTALYSTERGDYDYVMTVDGDSAPHPDALEHLLRAMSDPEVWAATGWVNTRNYRDNWVARCADLDIGIAMVMNRSSRTQIGAIETMSGALALYRAGLWWDEAEEYLADTVGAGDDRWMTARALLRGKAVGVNEAIVDTDMPTEIRRTFQQRVRWCKSTYLMAGYSIARYRPTQLIPPLINFIYIVTTPIGAAAALAAEIYNARHGYRLVAITWADLAEFLVVGFLSKVALVVLYLLRRPNMSLGQKLLSAGAGATLLFPFAVFAVVLPKYWAIFKLRQVRWATRDIKGVVVTVPEQREPAHPGRRHREDHVPLSPILATAMADRPGASSSHRDREQTAMLSLVDLTARLNEPPSIEPAVVRGD